MELGNVKRELKVLKIKSIRENPSALRPVNRQDPKYLELVASVKEVGGILNPILVREITSPGDEQLYGIIEGLHRYSAATENGLEEIPAQVINMNDAQVLQAQLIGNFHKVETKPAQYSEQLRRMLASDPLLTITRLATMCGTSTEFINQRLSLGKLKKEYSTLVDSGAINLSNAYSLAKLPEEEQENFVERARTMSPQEFTQTVLIRKKELDTAKRQGRDPKAAEFVAVPHLRRVTEIKDEMAAPNIGPILVRQLNLTKADEGFALGIRWALNMDPASVKLAQEKDLQRKKDEEGKKEKAAVQRAAKRALEAAETARKLEQEQKDRDAAKAQVEAAQS